MTMVTMTGRATSSSSRSRGHTYLYTLVRAAGHIDSDDLSIHDLSPAPGQPLSGAPALTDASTDSLNLPETPIHTHGLLNPDGILGIVPGSSPLKVIYEQKILSGDNTGIDRVPRICPVQHLLGKLLCQ